MIVSEPPGRMALCSEIVMVRVMDWICPSGTLKQFWRTPQDIICRELQAELVEKKAGREVADDNLLGLDGIIDELNFLNSNMYINF